MEFSIRPLRSEEYPMLEDFLYEAVFQDGNAPPLPRLITRKPELRRYIEDFGGRNGDFCLAAETEGRVIGAVWCRLIEGGGYAGGGAPELAISLLPGYRGGGIGTRLLRTFLDMLKKEGVAEISLSVQKANPVSDLYLREGFFVVSETETEYVMTAKLG